MTTATGKLFEGLIRAIVNRDREWLRLVSTQTSMGQGPALDGHSMTSAPSWQTGRLPPYFVHACFVLARCPA